MADFIYVLWKVGDQGTGTGKEHFGIKDGMPVCYIDPDDPKYQNWTPSPHTKKVFAVTKVPSALLEDIKDGLQPTTDKEEIDPKTYRPRKKKINFGALESFTGSIGLETSLRDASTVDVIDCTKEGFSALLTDTATLNPSQIDFNAVASGEFTVGSGGSDDYATWAAASSDVDSTVTDTLTFKQSTAVTETATSTFAPDLNGQTLNITSRVRPRKSPASGLQITVNVDANIFVISNTGLGTVNLCHLRMKRGAVSVTGAKYWILINGQDAATAINIHNNVQDGQNENSIVFIAVGGGGGENAIVSVWNNLLWGGYKGIYTTGAHTSNRYENNTIAEITGTGIDLYNTNVTTKNNFVESTGANYYQHGNAAGYNNAGTDATCTNGNWGTGSGNVPSLTVADEFESIVDTSGVDYFRVLAGSNLDTAGTSPGISLNTSGAQGNTRPHTGSSYSIGADELFVNTALQYAIEVETDASYSAAATGFNNGFLRVVTGRPGYDGTDTGNAIIPTGDNSVLKIDLGGAETISVSFQSGELYAASNGDFKAANTVPVVGSRFTVLDTSDFTGGELTTAKGGAPAEGDMFEVTNATAASEAVEYVGVNVWYEGLISKGSMTNPSREAAGLVKTGGYGTLSGFNFAVPQAFVAGSGTPFWKSMVDNDVAFLNKEVRLYSVIGDEFFQIWSGRVNNTIQTETDYKIVCKGGFKRDHKDFPPNTFNPKDYPNADEAFASDPVPVCFGTVPYARLIPVSGGPSFYNLVINGGVEHKTAMAYSYSVGATSTTLGLRIRRYGIQPFYSANYFAGAYLFVLSGGGSPDTTKGIRIISNTQGPSDMVFTLSEPVSNFVLGTHGYSGSADQIDKWQFAIAKLETTCVVSNAEVAEFKKDIHGLPQVFNYNMQNKSYDDIKHLHNESSVTNASYNDTATMDTLSNVLSKSGNTDILFPLPLISAGAEAFGELINIDASTFIPTITTTFSPVANMSLVGSVASIYDLDRSTYLEVQRTSTGAAMGTGTETSAVIYATIEIPESQNDASSFYFGADLEQASTAAHDQNIRIDIIFFDQYGNYATNKNFLHPGSASRDDTASWTDFNILPNEYYRLAITGNGANSEDSLFASDDGTATGEIKTAVTLDSSIITGLQNGSISNRVVIYISMIGEQIAAAQTYKLRIKQFGLLAEKSVDITSAENYTRLAGEEYNSTSSHSVYRIFRKILEDYDGISTSLIDYDNMANTRHNWFAARQITEKKNSFEYLKELAEQSFVSIYQDRKGKIKLTAWLDRDDTAHQHDEDSMIAGSIHNWKRTGVDYLYNNFTLRWGYNPGANSYFQQYQIANVDDSTAGPDCQFEEMWNICRICYNLYNVIREFKMDLPWYQDFEKYSNVGDSTNGVPPQDAARYFLQQCIFWLTREKRRVSYRIPMNADNATIELCDPVNFRDAVFTDSKTDSSYIAGSVEKIEYDLKKDQIIITSLLDPEDSVDDGGYIYETGDAPDTITESGSQSDTITEVGL